MSIGATRGKIVVLSGSGLSAESGLPTFRDAGGMWNQYAWHEVASPEGWRKHPEAVLAFYNERRARAWEVHPNAAHLAIAELEQDFEVVIVTQNVDGLHERAGSTSILHVHGELAYAKGTGTSTRRYRLGDKPIHMGDLAEDGSQLRPDIVWFGEQTQLMEQAAAHIAGADKVLVVGTSLSVYPAAGLVRHAPKRAEKVLNALDIETLPYGYDFMPGRATEVIPALARQWRGA